MPKNMVWANETMPVVAQQQGRRLAGQHDEDADLGRDVQRLGAGKQERRDREADQDRDQRDASQRLRGRSSERSARSIGYLLATG
jgi:hypothetical protein